MKAKAEAEARVNSMLYYFFAIFAINTKHSLTKCNKIAIVKTLV